MKIFIDTGAFIALTASDDDNHKEARPSIKMQSKRGPDSLQQTLLSVKR